MNEACAVCGLKFEREPGYFVGSMYISYAIAAAYVTPVALGLQALFPALTLWWLVSLVGLALLPAVPVIIRYSRTLWIHLDRAIDPD